jgi:hypothetical protein
MPLIRIVHGVLVENRCLCNNLQIFALLWILSLRWPLRIYLHKGLEGLLTASVEICWVQILLLIIVCACVGAAASRRCENLYLIRLTSARCKHIPIVHVRYIDCHGGRVINRFCVYRRMPYFANHLRRSWRNHLTWAQPCPYRWRHHSSIVVAVLTWFSKAVIPRSHELQPIVFQDTQWIIVV